MKLTRSSNVNYVMESSGANGDVTEDCLVESEDNSDDRRSLESLFFADEVDDRSMTTDSSLECERKELEGSTSEGYLSAGRTENITNQRT